MASQTDAAENPSSFYLLDAHDQIVDAGGLWDEFARENDGGNALVTRVLGTCIFDHISGDTSTMFLDSLLKYTRTLKRSSTRCYRCDSPGIKRFMEMNLVPQTDGGVLVVHRLLRTEILPGQFIFTVQRGVNIFAVRCSMCNRLKIDGEWTEPDQAFASGKLVANHQTAVIYGVCPECKGGLTVNPHLSDSQK